MFTGTPFATDALPATLLHPVPYLQHLYIQGTEQLVTLRRLPDMSRQAQLRELGCGNSFNLEEIEDESFEGLTGLVWVRFGTFQATETEVLVALPT